MNENIAPSQPSNPLEEPQSPPSDDAPAESNPEEPTEEIYDVDLLSKAPYGYIINSSISGSYSLMTEFLNEVESKTGVKMPKHYLSDNAKNREIVIGTVMTRQESIDSSAPFNEYNNRDISIYAMKFYGERLIVTATDTESFQYALKRLLTFVTSDGFKIPSNIDELVIFDSSAYAKNGTVKEYSKEELDTLAYLTSISVGDGVISDFDKEKMEYAASTNCSLGYPTVSAQAWLPDMKVSINQATSQNGGIATVTVTGRNCAQTLTYKVNFIMDEYYTAKSEVVNKGGTKGTVTFVLDDGIISTAEYVEELLKKYPYTTATFGLVTKNYADFVLSDDKTEYLRDENGNFIFTQTDAQKEKAEYWKGLLERFPRVELASHSHTHAYAGEDDSVVYTAYDNNGKKYIFPKGSISAEVYGSRQLIEKLFGRTARTFILPGISNKESGFSINPWSNLIRSWCYLGARGTYTSVDYESMVTPRDFIKDESRRWRVKAFMVRYFNMALNASGNFYPEYTSTSGILAAGISHATNFIDAAMSDGSFACFCIHAIVNSGSTGNNHIYKEQADALFAYANMLAEKGDTWVATLGDAYAYYCAWDTAVTTASAHSDKSIDLTVKTEENEFYTVPLTVKVKVPMTWEKAVVIFGEEQTPLSVFIDEDGTRYVLADMLPNSGTATILPQNP